MEFLSLLLALGPMILESMCGSIENLKNISQIIPFLKSDLKVLVATRKDFQDKIEQSKQEGLTCSARVTEWIVAAEDAEDRANLILHRHEQRKRRLLKCFKSSCSKHKQARDADRLLVEINELILRATNIPVVGSLLIEPVIELPCRPALGLNTMLEVVSNFLADHEAGTIGVYGMGGVGKTTLLKNINNGFLDNLHNYDVVIWVVVSRDLFIDRIQQVIADRLGLSWNEAQNEEQRATGIHRVLSKKKFVLLFDDLWETIDLERIGVPFPNHENKCKVIFSTRTMDICCSMDAKRMLRVDFLGQEESWELFCEKVARRDVLDSTFIQPLAKRIAAKCEGLPLALITVARAVGSRDTKEEWEAALDALNRSPTQLQGIQNVFIHLKFSYDYLNNDQLRACFLYCALFPEDYPIEKEQLISYWIGEGFLAGFSGTSAYNKGHEIIGSLKLACLLEAGEEKTQIKVHDVVRSFALWIASEYGTKKKLIYVKSSAGLTGATDAGKWRDALVVSFLENDIKTLPDQPRCPGLKTLLLQGSNGLTRIPIGFFRCMLALRVLDLSSTGIEEIPPSIEHLGELRYLNLSGTRISRLPEELGYLRKLKHLDLRRTPFLQTIPRSAICGLNKLEVLNLYYSYAGWELQSSGNSDEISFADLECLKRLVGLGLTVISLDTLKRLNQFGALHNCVQYLYIEKCDGVSNMEFLAGADLGQRLRRLSIKNCQDLESIEMWTDHSKNRLPSLEVLTLHSLPNLTTVWRHPISQECLASLCTIDIWYCHSLKTLSWVLQLPKLELINLFHCEQLEEVVSEYPANPAADFKQFPSLRTLSMRNLPRLRSIVPSQFSFPSLESLAVIGCPELTKLPFQTGGDLKAPTVYGTREWWDNLEWPETVLLPQFVSI